MTEPKLRLADVQTFEVSKGVKSGSRNDLIRHLVTLLHKNVRYTGVEFGESKLIPQFPAETLKRKYGDCKDKAAFLVAVLRNAGIAANLALLDSGPGRELNTELPGMGMFDHAIVYVPASGNDTEVWIDATAKFSPVGTLPWMDYGRWALIVSEKTDKLAKIPELTAATNVHRELREFTLAEYGPAAIVETDDEIGPQDADYREYYSGDNKKARENGEKYVKGAYLANSLTSLEHGDLSDLEKPGTIKFVTSGKRGTTDLASAIMAIRVEALFDSLPDYFKSKEKDQETDSADKEKEKPRTADWRLTPFTVEWQYKVTAPAGFRLRTLPADKQEQIGTVSFKQHYSSNADGTMVEAVLRTENQDTRLTVEQAEESARCGGEGAQRGPYLRGFRSHRAFVDVLREDQGRTGGVSIAGVPTSEGRVAQGATGASVVGRGSSGAGTHDYPGGNRPGPQVGVGIQYSGNHFEKRSSRTTAEKGNEL